MGSEIFTDDPVWAGIDIGTQGVRVALVDGRGKVLATGSAPLQSVRGPGRRHEQDPRDWWRAACAACAEATAAVDAGRVRALAVCSTSGTFLLADAAARPLTPALMYDDDRGGPYAERVGEEGRDLWARLSLRVQASWPLPKLLWLAAGGGLPAGARLLHSADYLAAMLAGGLTATDSSHALKTGYDSLNERWPAEVLARLDLPGTLFGPVVRPGTPIGVVAAEAARLTGLPEGCQIIAGMTDGCAGQIAAGALTPGAGVSVLGTTLVLKGVSADLLHDPDGAVYSHRHPDGGWLPGGASNVGAGVLAAAFPGRDLADLDRRAARHEPAGQVVYPLTARGERFPFYRPDAEQVSVGRAGSEEEHYAALLQGVAYGERLGLAALALLGAPVTGSLALVGGATRSAYWSQLRADVLGMPVEIPRHPEAAVGMAVLAAAGAAGEPLSRTAELMIPRGARVEPRPDRVERFEKSFARLVEALVEREYVTPELAAEAVA
ncbi:carbohydrate kinase [Microtetraspora sp. NBRC 13810]|uniref:FGGY-family carbohydrate kinase n=1 Tax=Microtetraspora sp. NBRC 13810 TaxID=3030990 RepID=UPI0024A49685|nr:FGGY family carbohydrate kinase [Microtetraspora sp. NBRC 13810]GLW12056.1 carbohydrate kinase [Microtetraspora sp. NBRC 13810]